MYHWNIMDAGTRYLLASHLSESRGTDAARIVIQKALKVADKPPQTIKTDGWERTKKR